MEQLIFATNNLHKVEEIKKLIPGKLFDIKSLQEAGIIVDIPEPHNTLEKNATEKSTVIYSLTRTNCFSEDTGLEVEALDGEPGVRSARYAEDKTFKDNIDKLLFKLRAKLNRKAQFRTVISLILKGNEYTFEGICKGIIIAERRGVKGFGYDSVFMPDGAEKTFAEMSLEEKNIYSHRRKAVDKLIEFLQKKL